MSFFGFRFSIRVLDLDTYATFVEDEFGSRTPPARAELQSL